MIKRTVFDADCCDLLCDIGAAPDNCHGAFYSLLISPCVCLSDQTILHVDKLNLVAHLHQTGDEPVPVESPLHGHGDQLRVGWALGDGQEHGDDPAWDAVEAGALYDLLERKLIPEFYARDESGTPTAWVKRMRESMARLTPRFSTNRTVREYTEQHYLPAAAAYRQRVADQGALGRQVVDWQHAVDQKWGSLGFGDVRGDTDSGQHVVEDEIFLSDLDPNAVRVELHADAINGDDTVPEKMKWLRTLPDASRRCVYHATLPSARPASDYTARVIPQRSGVAVPLECARILWQR